MRLAFALSIQRCRLRLPPDAATHLRFDHLESTSGVICVEMARKFDEAGFRMVEIPVSHYPRLHGRSEFFRLRHLSHTLKGLLRIWWSLVALAPATRMDDYRGKKVLVTGGLGFIGSNVAIRLVELGATVTIVDNLDPTGGANYFNIEPVKERHRNR